VVNGNAKDIIEYKVQIASGKNKVALKAYNFKGLKDVQIAKVGSYYKYYYGVTSTFKKVLISLKIAKQKGYKSAFVVAFKNGEKISLNQAKK
jgi:N-acetylmuramoyl-L-alanine amidase